MRVVEAVRRGGPDLSALRAGLHLDLAVVGSFQRSGPRLRITARVVDAATCRYTLAVMSNYGGGAEPIAEKVRSLILAGQGRTASR